MKAPEWFLKQLKDLGEYYLVWNEQNLYWEVKHSLTFVRWRDRLGEFQQVTVNPTVAVFKTLNDAAMDELKRRRKVAEEWDYTSDPRRYWEHLKKQERESRRKAKQMGREQMAEGLMKIVERELNKQKKIFT